MNSKNLSISKLSSGFTLIELMIVVVIVAILLSLAAPSFNNLITETRIRSERNKLFSDIRLVRAEAIKQRVSPVFCKSTDGVNCGGNSVNWEDGWVAFIDDGAGGAGVAGDSIVNGDEGDSIIVQQSALISNTTITPTTATHPSIDYGPDGFLDNNLTTFWFCETGFNNSYQIVVNLVGRPRIEKPDPVDISGCR